MRLPSSPWATRGRLSLFLLLLVACCLLLYFSPTVYSELWLKPRLCRAYRSSASPQRLANVRALLSQSRTAANRSAVAPSIFSALAAHRSGVPGSLSTLAGRVRIFTHGRHDYISRSILRGHGWEDENRRAVERLLLADPSLHLLDIGTNIGVFALTAAQHRRKVVAVDANRRNLALLARSVAANPHFPERITLVHNALGNAYGEVVVRENPVNIGGSGVDRFDGKKDDRSVAVKTVLLDDLLAVIPFRRAIVKIDIEANEYLAMAGANRFFTEMDVPFILMEWSGQMERLYGSLDFPGAAFLATFLKERGYEAFAVGGWRRLSENFCSWPTDILLKRKEKQRQ